VNKDYHIAYYRYTQRTHKEKNKALATNAIEIYQQMLTTQYYYCMVYATYTLSHSLWRWRIACCECQNFTSCAPMLLCCERHTYDHA